MTPIQWQENAQVPRTPSAQSNIWFAVSMGLIGLILGFIAARVLA